MASWQQVGLGGIDSDGGILSKNSWRGPQLQITPSYSCLSSTRGGGGLGLAGTRAFDALRGYIGVQLIVLDGSVWDQHLDSRKDLRHFFNEKKLFFHVSHFFCQRCDQNIRNIQAGLLKYEFGKLCS